AGVGAPHIRDRAYWVGYSERARLQRLAGDGHNGYQPGRVGAHQAGSTTETGGALRVADSDSEQHDRGGVIGQTGRPQYPDSGATADEQPSTGPTNGFWADADWLFCRDGKWRPVRSGTFPLAHGVTNRVGRLRAYGNAINAEAAKAFIECFMEYAQ